MSRYEAPRGEDVHYVRANGTEKPERVKARALTLANTQAVAKMLEDGYLADLPIVIAAISNPRFSCTDRMIGINDHGSGPRRVMSWEELSRYGVDFYRCKGIDPSRIAGEVPRHDSCSGSLSDAYFPRFFFLIILGLAGQFVDRKLYARSRTGSAPPGFQPVADFFKLLGKESVIPEEADKRMFTLAPVFALGAVIASSFSFPCGTQNPCLHSKGTFWWCCTCFSFRRSPSSWWPGIFFDLLDPRGSAVNHAAVRLRDPAPDSGDLPALLANTWSISGLVQYYTSHPGRWLFNLIGLAVAMVTLLGKLEKVPFDIPEAETKIVAGTFTEYSGRFSRSSDWPSTPRPSFQRPLWRPSFCPSVSGWRPGSHFSCTLRRSWQSLPFLLSCARFSRG